MRRFLGWLVLMLGSVLPGLTVQADESGLEFFEAKVRPLLADRCLKCHDDAKAKGGLRLTSRASILLGGDLGPAAVAGKPDESVLVQAIRYEDEPHMPPKAKLADAEIAILTRWVEIGLPWPETRTKPAQGAGESEKGFTEEQRRFWSFQPVGDFAPPVVKDVGWPQSNIDRFILAPLEAKGLAPTPGADKRTLIRRATFDLTGLPPTPEEVEAFLQDDAPDAFARVVERLLGSPHYGERWGRHWLDVVRYADSRDARGIGGDSDITEAWRYRDWVVNAFNNDLPYDQFLIRQLAGDRIQPDSADAIDADALVATGFLTIGEWGTGDADKEKMMTDIVDDQIDVVGRAMLGLTLACARCHDHKFDPIPTRDYYGLAGIFFSTHILPEPGAKTGGSPLLRTPLVSQTTLDEAKRHKTRVAELEAQRKTETAAAYAALSRSLLPETTNYLRAVWNRNQDSNVSNTLTKFASDHGLRADVLRGWTRYLGLDDDGRLMAKAVTNVQGVSGVFVWKGEPDCPSLTVNTTAAEVPLLTFRLPPKSVSVHPGPSSGVALTWRSPIAGRVQVSGRLADADPAGGDGVAWIVSQRRGAVARPIASGDLPNGGAQSLDAGRDGARLKTLDVQHGDVIRLVVLPKQGHICDTTAVELNIKLADGPDSWNLALDLLADPLAQGQGNPHADRAGRPDVWSFTEIDDQGTAPNLPPALNDWVRAVEAGDPGAIETAAVEVGRVVTSGTDPALIMELLSPKGPFHVEPHDDLADLPAETAGRLSALRDELASLNARPTQPIPLALAAREGGVPKSAHEGIHDARVHIRGNYRRLGPVVPRHFPTILAGDQQAPINQGSGRLELARWIARADHPLTARVMVNRIWQHHFGEGIVRTPSNFGALGERPTHPELLDALARRFISLGWSVKAMHRAIMLSSVYQQASTPSEEMVQADPENRLFGRMNRRRLESESIRDSLLAVSGRLDRSLGGPSVRELANPRRTLYLMTIRSDRASFGPLFDAADSTAIVDRRTVSTVAPQALFLLNSPFALDAAQGLAQRIKTTGPADIPGRIRHAYALLFGRPPTAVETAIGLRLLGQGDDAAWLAYSQVLLCTNEFLFVD